MAGAWLSLINEVKWMIVLKGAILAIILGTILSLVAGNDLEFIAYALAAMHVGYSVKGDDRNRAINGAAVAIIGTIVVAIITGIIAFVAEDFSILNVQLAIGAVIVNAIIGAAAGIIGLHTKGLEWVKELEVVPIIIGAFFAVILGAPLSIFFLIGEGIAFFLVAIFIGYYINGDYYKGAMHGIVIALIGTIAASSFIGLVNTANGYEDEYFIQGIYITALILPMNLGCGASGGAIGSFIKMIIDKFKPK